MKGLNDISHAKIEKYLFFGNQTLPHSRSCTGYRNVGRLTWFITVPSFRPISLSVPVNLTVTDRQTNERCYKGSVFLFRYATLKIT